MFSIFKKITIILVKNQNILQNIKTRLTTFGGISAHTLENIMLEMSINKYDCFLKKHALRFNKQTIKHYHNLTVKIKIVKSQGIEK